MYSPNQNEDSRNQNTVQPKKQGYHIPLMVTLNLNDLPILKYMIVSILIVSVAFACVVIQQIQDMQAEKKKHSISSND